METSFPESSKFKTRVTLLLAVYIVVLSSSFSPLNHLRPTPTLFNF